MPKGNSGWGKEKLRDPLTHSGTLAGVEREMSFYETACNQLE